MPSTASAQKTLVAVADLAADDGLAFRPLFEAKMIEDAFNKFGVDFRDRIFPPDVTLMAFCSQLIGRDRSCRNAVTLVNTDRARRGLPQASTSSSAYCQARSRLPMELIAELSRAVAGEMEKSAKPEWLWQGRRVRLLDGSTLSMPDTPENQEVWPQHDGQDDGVGFPLMRVVALISLATAGVIDFAFGAYKGKETGELALARELLRSLAGGDIVLADRYYCSYFFICMLLEHGVDIITRQHGARDSDFRRGRQLGYGDHLIELMKPPRPQWMDKATYGRMPESLTLREVKTGHIDDDGDEVIVATTLLSPEKYSKTELVACSKRRWNVELDLRSMKTVMGMDILSCKTPEMITKEVWTYILAYNLVRQLISRAAEKHNVEPRHISFTGAIQTFVAFLPLFEANPSSADAVRYYEIMLGMISSHRIGNRPNRREPKAVKRRPKPYPRLQRPRSELKAKLSCRQT
jgi:hypothetical protein